MNSLTLPVVMLALAVPALAQGSLTTPAGGLTLEGDSAIPYFGAWPDARHQQIDFTHGGQKATLKEIAFRLDYRAHTSETAMGRTWTNVSLHTSEMDFSKIRGTFSNNVTSPQTRVFNARWIWPTQSGLPPSKPAPWGGPSNSLALPFNTPWAYTGKQAMLMDYRFTGGTLANNAKWTEKHFYLDGDAYSQIKRTKMTSLPSVVKNCMDSAHTGLPSYFGARMNATGAARGGEFHIIRLRNKIEITHYTDLTAPHPASVLHAIGLGGTTAGVEIGARCNRLHVDLSKPLILLTLPVSANGTSYLMGWALPWQPEFAHLVLYFQAAWADSKTGAFSLTSATRLTLPSGLPPPKLTRIAHVISQDSKSPQGIPAVSWAYFPYTRYSF